MDKSVKNLDQFKPGDKLQVSYTEEIVMMAGKSQGGAVAAPRYGVVGISPEGQKPAIVQVDTTEIAGKIFSIDPNRRRITVEDPDGKKRTLRLSKRVENLAQFKPGDNLNMAVTEETAIEVVG